ncbi:hypothetical protein BSP21_071 [Bacillus phage BSP21]|uniref:hypothetical protein n=1 Tax=Bacillus phage SPG24 TaxID=1497851 RepID=UPI0022BA634B|nr:hypothetical protein IM043_gp086 [Bacillus phage SPG24]AYJ75406.1 hypothetical protein BSP21_071 [Bacillus phage BSP21]AYJ75808.1 hypothetical protein BSP18_174 [Bacillus phage BSP18]
MKKNLYEETGFVPDERVMHISMAQEAALKELFEDYGGHVEEILDVIESNWDYWKDNEFDDCHSLTHLGQYALTKIIMTGEYTVRDNFEQVILERIEGVKSRSTKESVVTALYQVLKDYRRFKEDELNAKKRAARRMADKFYPR